MYGANPITKTEATPGQFLVSQTCFTVFARIRRSLYTKHSLCGAHERQGPEAFSGTELARGARSSIRGFEQVCRHHALRRAEYYPKPNRRPRHGRGPLPSASPLVSTV